MTAITFEWYRLGSADSIIEAADVGSDGGVFALSIALRLLRYWADPHEATATLQ